MFHHVLEKSLCFSERQNDREGNQAAPIRHPNSQIAGWLSSLACSPRFSKHSSIERILLQAGVRWNEERAGRSGMGSSFLVGRTKKTKATSDRATTDRKTT